MVDLQAEIARYVGAAIRYGDAKAAVDLYGASMAEDEVIDALLRIRTISDGSLQPIEVLLSHVDSDVRYWAAMHLL